MRLDVPGGSRRTLESVGRCRIRGALEPDEGMRVGESAQHIVDVAAMTVRGALLVLVALCLSACAEGGSGIVPRGRDGGGTLVVDAGGSADAEPRCAAGSTLVCTTSCGSAGLATCTGGSPSACDPPDETCDGEDEDCDGAVDEDVADQPCSADCGGGTSRCEDGAMTSCSGRMPVPETCDGTDEDCDDIVDEGLTRACSSACGDGSQSCSAGTWDACSAPSPGTESCDGTDEDCDGMIDEGTFGAFFVGAGSSTWHHYDLSCGSPFAPSTVVQTVFDLDSPPRAYFLTATTYHVLDLSSLDWTGTGARDEIVPELSGSRIRAAFSVPPSPGEMQEGVYLFADDQVYVYAADLGSAPTFSLATLNNGAPNPKEWMLAADTTTAYMSRTGTWGIDPRPMCATATADHGPYTAYVGSTSIVFYDNGWCFDCIGTTPIALQAPFSSSSAPPRDAWKHAAYSAGLWLFASIGLPGSP